MAEPTVEIYPMDYKALLDGELPLPQLLADIHTNNQNSPNGKLKRTFDAVREGLSSPEHQTHPRREALTLVIDTLAGYYEQYPTLAKVQAVKGDRLDREVPQPILPRGQKPKTWTVSRLLTDQLAKSDKAIDDALLASLKVSSPSKDPLEITVDEDCPHLAESLGKIQAALGPIKSLTIKPRAEPEEGDDKESESTAAENPQLVQAINQCQGLEALNVAGVKLSFSQLNWPVGLRHVNIEETDIEAKDLHKLTTTCRKLTTLLMQGCRKLSFEELMQIDYPLLEEFSYTHLWKDEETPEKEAAQISEIEKKHVKNPVVLTILAEVMIESRNPLKKQAADLLADVLKANPHCLRARATLAELVRKGAQDVKKDEAESLGLIEQSLDINRYHLRSLACRARHLINSASELKQTEATELARELYNRAPNDDFILATYAYCYWVTTTTDQASEKALELLDKALMLNPHNYYALNVKSDILKGEESWKCAELAYQINPYDETIIISYVDGLLESEDQDDKAEAVKVLLDALKTHEKFALAHVRLGQLADENTPQVAKTHYEDALKIDPTCIEALKGLAQIHAGKGSERNIKAAITLYERAFRIKPDDLEIIADLCECLLDEDAEEMTNPAKAQQLLLKACKIAPKDPRLVGLLGETYLIHDGHCDFNEELGIHCLKSAIEAKSQVAWNHLKLAEFYANIAGQGEEAQRHYEEAVKDDPDSPEIRLSFAKFWLKSFTENDPPDFDKAEQMLEPLLKEETFEAKAAILQAHILLLRDAEQNKEEAVGYIRQALAETLFLPAKKMLSELLTDYPDKLGAVRGELIKVLAT